MKNAVLTPADGPRLAQLAAFLLGEGDTRAAGAAAQLATAAAPQSFEAWLALAVARAKSNESKQAVHAYLKALEIDPQNIACWTALGELYLSLMRYEQAAAALRQSMTLDPKSEHPAGRRARAVSAMAMAKLSKGKS